MFITLVPVPQRQGHCFARSATLHKVVGELEGLAFPIVPELLHKDRLQQVLLLLSWVQHIFFFRSKNYKQRVTTIRGSAYSYKNMSVSSWKMCTKVTPPCVLTQVFIHSHLQDQNVEGVSSWVSTPMAWKQQSPAALTVMSQFSPLCVAAFAKVSSKAM